MAGVIVNHFTYSTGFLTFAAATCATGAVLFFAMLETAPEPAALASVGREFNS